ncbi:11710_t:CDS:2, partial [Acaulospora colombiana]
MNYEPDYGLLTSQYITFLGLGPMNRQPFTSWVLYREVLSTAPLQVNGLAPVWLRRQVWARGRLVHILPQEVQGNLFLCDVDVGKVATGVGVGPTAEGVGCPNDWLEGTIQPTGRSFELNVLKKREQITSSGGLE